MTCNYMVALEELFDKLPLESQKRVLAGTKLLLQIEEKRNTITDLVTVGKNAAAGLHLEDLREYQTLLNAMWQNKHI